MNSESLEVSYLHLADSKAILAYFLANSPAPMLELFSDVAMEAILIFYPAYERIHSEVHVRITDLPTSCTLRDLRRSHLNSLVRVSGVVTRRSGVFPQLKYVSLIWIMGVNMLLEFVEYQSKQVRDKPVHWPCSVTISMDKFHNVLPYVISGAYNTISTI